MVNWRRLACASEQAALPNFGRYSSCVSGWVAAAAARAASCELRPGLSNFNSSCGSCKFPPLSNFKGAAIRTRSQILPCIAAAFDVANCRTQFVQSEPSKIMSWILVLKKIFPNADDLNYLKSWTCFCSQELNLSRSVYLFPNFESAAILIFS